MLLFTKTANFTAKLCILGMQTFQDTFKTCKLSLFSVFSICITESLKSADYAFIVNFLKS